MEWNNLKMEQFKMEQWNFKMEQYIPYSLICDLFSRNLKTFHFIASQIMQYMRYSPEQLVGMIELEFVTLDT